MIENIIMSQQSLNDKVKILEKLSSEPAFIEVLLDPRAFLKDFVPFARIVLQEFKPSSTTQRTRENEVRVFILRLLSRFNYKGFFPPNDPIPSEIITILYEVFKNDNIFNKQLGLKVLYSLLDTEPMLESINYLNIIHFIFIKDYLPHPDSVDDGIFSLSFHVAAEGLEYLKAFQIKYNHPYNFYDSVFNNICRSINAYLSSETFFEKYRNSKLVIPEYIFFTLNLLEFSNLFPLPIHHVILPFISELCYSIAIFCPQDCYFLKKNIINTIINSISARPECFSNIERYFLKNNLYNVTYAPLKIYLLHGLCQILVNCQSTIKNNKPIIYYEFDARITEFLSNNPNLALIAASLQAYKINLHVFKSLPFEITDRKIFVMRNLRNAYKAYLFLHSNHLSNEDELLDFPSPATDLKNSFIKFFDYIKGIIQYISSQRMVLSTLEPNFIDILSELLMFPLNDYNEDIQDYNSPIIQIVESDYFQAFLDLQPEDLLQLMKKCVSDLILKYYQKVKLWCVFLENGNVNLIFIREANKIIHNDFVFYNYKNIEFYENIFPIAYSFFKLDKKYYKNDFVEMFTIVYDYLLNIKLPCPVLEKRYFGILNTMYLNIKNLDNAYVGSYFLLNVFEKTMKDLYTMYCLRFDRFYIECLFNIPLSLNLLVTKSSLFLKPMKIALEQGCPLREIVLKYIEYIIEFDNSDGALDELLLTIFDLMCQYDVDTIPILSRISDSHRSVLNSKKISTLKIINSDQISLKAEISFEEHSENIEINSKTDNKKQQKAQKESSSAKFIKKNKRKAKIVKNFINLPMDDTIRSLIPNLIGYVFIYDYVNPKHHSYNNITTRSLRGVEVNEMFKSNARRILIDYLIYALGFKELDRSRIFKFHTISKIALKYEFHDEFELNGCFNLSFNSSYKSLDYYYRLYQTASDAIIALYLDDEEMSFSFLKTFTKVYAILRRKYQDSKTNDYHIIYMYKIFTDSLIDAMIYSPAKAQRIVDFYYQLIDEGIILAHKNEKRICECEGLFKKPHSMFDKKGEDESPDKKSYKDPCACTDENENSLKFTYANSNLQSSNLCGTLIINHSENIQKLETENGNENHEKNNKSESKEGTNDLQFIFCCKNSFEESNFGHKAIFAEGRICDLVDLIYSESDLKCIRALQGIIFYIESTLKDYKIPPNNSGKHLKAFIPLSQRIMSLIFESIRYILKKYDSRRVYDLCFLLTSAIFQKFEFLAREIFEKIFNKDISQNKYPLINMLYSEATFIYSLHPLSDALAQMDKYYISKLLKMDRAAIKRFSNLGNLIDSFLKNIEKKDKNSVEAFINFLNTIKSDKGVVKDMLIPAKKFLPTIAVLEGFPTLESRRRFVESVNKNGNIQTSNLSNFNVYRSLFHNTSLSPNIKSYFIEIFDNQSPEFQGYIFDIILGSEKYEAADLKFIFEKMPFVIEIPNSNSFNLPDRIRKAYEKIKRRVFLAPHVHLITLIPLLYQQHVFIFFINFVPLIPLLYDLFKQFLSEYIEHILSLKVNDGGRPQYNRSYVHSGNMSSLYGQSKNSFNAYKIPHSQAEIDCHSMVSLQILLYLKNLGISCGNSKLLFIVYENLQYSNFVSELDALINWQFPYFNIEDIENLHSLNPSFNITSPYLFEKISIVKSPILKLWLLRNLKHFVKNNNSFININKKPIFFGDKESCIDKCLDIITSNCFLHCESYSSSEDFFSSLYDDKSDKKLENDSEISLPSDELFNIPEHPKFAMKSCFAINTVDHGQMPMLFTIPPKLAFNLDFLIPLFSDNIHPVIELFSELDYFSQEMIRICKYSLEDKNLKHLSIYYLCRYEPDISFFSKIFTLNSHERSYAVKALCLLIDKFSISPFIQSIRMVMQAELRFKSVQLVLLPLIYIKKEIAEVPEIFQSLCVIALKMFTRSDFDYELLSLIQENFDKLLSKRFIFEASNSGNDFVLKPDADSSKLDASYISHSSTIEEVNNIQFNKDNTSDKNTIFQSKPRIYGYRQLFVALSTSKNEYDRLILFNYLSLIKELNTILIIQELNKNSFQLFNKTTNFHFFRIISHSNTEAVLNHILSFGFEEYLEFKQEIARLVVNNLHIDLSKTLIKFIDISFEIFKDSTPMNQLAALELIVEGNLYGNYKDLLYFFLNNFSIHDYLQMDHFDLLHKISILDLNRFTSWILSITVPGINTPIVVLELIPLLLHKVEPLVAVSLALRKPSNMPEYLRSIVVFHFCRLYPSAFDFFKLEFFQGCMSPLKYIRASHLDLYLSKIPQIGLNALEFFLRSDFDGINDKTIEYILSVILLRIMKLKWCDISKLAYKCINFEKILEPEKTLRKCCCSKPINCLSNENSLAKDYSCANNSVFTEDFGEIFENELINYYDPHIFNNIYDLPLYSSENKSSIIHSLRAYFRILHMSDLLHLYRIFYSSTFPSCIKDLFVPAFLENNVSIDHIVYSSLKPSSRYYLAIDDRQLYFGLVRSTSGIREMKDIAKLCMVKKYTQAINKIFEVFKGVESRLVSYKKQDLRILEDILNFIYNENDLLAFPISYCDEKFILRSSINNSSNLTYSRVNDIKYLTQDSFLNMNDSLYSSFNGFFEPEILFKNFEQALNHVIDGNKDPSKFCITEETYQSIDKLHSHFKIVTKTPRYSYLREKVIFYSAMCAEILESATIIKENIAESIYGRLRMWMIRSPSLKFSMKDWALFMKWRTFAFYSGFLKVNEEHKKKLSNEMCKLNLMYAKKAQSEKLYQKATFILNEISNTSNVESNLLLEKYLLDIECLYHMKDYNTIIAVINSININRFNNPEDKALLYYWLANAYKSMNKHSEAEKFNSISSKIAEIKENRKYSLNLLKCKLDKLQDNIKNGPAVYSTAQIIQDENNNFNLVDQSFNFKKRFAELNSNSSKTSQQIFSSFKGNSPAQYSDKNSQDNTITSLFDQKLFNNSGYEINEQNKIENDQASLDQQTLHPGIFNFRFNSDKEKPVADTSNENPSDKNSVHDQTLIPEINTYAEMQTSTETKKSNDSVSEYHETNRVYLSKLIALINNLSIDESREFIVQYIRHGQYESIELIEEYKLYFFLPQLYESIKEKYKSKSNSNSIFYFNNTDELLFKLVKKNPLLLISSKSSTNIFKEYAFNEKNKYNSCKGDMISKINKLDKKVFSDSENENKLLEKYDSKIPFMMQNLKRKTGINYEINSDYMGITDYHKLQGISGFSSNSCQTDCVYCPIHGSLEDSSNQKDSHVCLVHNMLIADYYNNSTAFSQEDIIYIEKHGLDVYELKRLVERFLDIELSFMFKETIIQGALHSFDQDISLPGEFTKIRNEYDNIKKMSYIETFYTALQKVTGIFHVRNTDGTISRVQISSSENESNINSMFKVPKHNQMLSILSRDLKLNETCYFDLSVAPIVDGVIVHANTSFTLDSALKIRIFRKKQQLSSLICRYFENKKLFKYKIDYFSKTADEFANTLKLEMIDRISDPCDFFSFRRSFIDSYSSLHAALYILGISNFNNESFYIERITGQCSISTFVSSKSLYLRPNIAQFLGLDGLNGPLCLIMTHFAEEFLQNNYLLDACDLILGLDPSNKLNRLSFNGINENSNSVELIINDMIDPKTALSMPAHRLPWL